MQFWNNGNYIPFTIPQDTWKPQHNTKLNNSKSNVIEVLTYYRQTGKKNKHKILITNKEHPFAATLNMKIGFVLN